MNDASTLAASMLCESESTSGDSERSRLGAKTTPKLLGPILFSSLCSLTNRKNWEQWGRVTRE